MGGGVVNFIPSDGKKEEEIQKVIVKCLCFSEIYESVGPLIEMNNEVSVKKLDPIFAPRPRRHIKNKTFFPLMEGEVLRGVISGFSRYEITLSMKGGLPLTILRHAVYDLRDKNGRCYLKKAVESRGGRLFLGECSGGGVSSPPPRRK